MNGTVVVKGGGGAGLGDRIRAVVSGIALAKLTGRELFVDWTDGAYGPVGLNVFSELFQVRGLRLAATLPASESVDPVAWRGSLHLSMEALYTQDGCPPWNHLAAVERYSTNLSAVQREEEVLVLFDYLQFPKLRQELDSKLGISRDLSEEQALGALLREYLQLQPAVAAVIDEFAAAHLQQRPAIGVHVRLTHEAIAQKGSVSLSRYFSVIDRILDENRGGMIFLSTDNANVVQGFVTRYPNCVTRDKWFAPPGEPLHLNPACPDKFRHALEAVVDMYLLARCDYLLHSGNSSFSLVSGMAAGLPADRDLALGPDRRSVLRRILSIGNRVLSRIR